jgi:hypothetical protein
MIKSFMNSGSRIRGTELDEDPGGSDTMPFPVENIVMMVYDGHPSLGRCHVSKLSPGPWTHCGWGRGGAQGCKGTNFPISLYICECVHYKALEYMCEFVHYSRSKRRKQEQRMVG